MPGTSLRGSGGYNRKREREEGARVDAVSEGMPPNHTGGLPQHRAAYFVPSSKQKKLVEHHS